MTAPPADRLQRALISLDGLSTGDAFGEMMSICSRNARTQLARFGLLPGMVRHTDDTQMAMAIVEVLARHQRVEQDALGTRFAERFEADPLRGYGSGARRQLERMLLGQSWRVGSAAAFGGRGSMGNGGAMRVAPLGAWFAEDDLDRVVSEATLSAEVTHAHAEGIAGAVAVALAAAVVWRNREAEVWRPPPNWPPVCWGLDF